MKTNKKKSHNNSTKSYTWNLGLLYSSSNDPKIERDVCVIEKSLNQFAKTYDTPNKKYLNNEDSLLSVLKDYEKMLGSMDSKPLYYFQYLSDLEADNPIAPKQISLMDNRLTKAHNDITFFVISLGTIPASKQKLFLASPKLKDFKVFLQRIFDDAKHWLSTPEEKIINLKGRPAHDMWIEGNEMILNIRSILWKGKKMPLSAAISTVALLPKALDRKKISALIATELKAVAPFSQWEINALVTNKKINDQLRGHASPHENTVRMYRNDPVVINNLVKTVTKHFNIAHRFYALKAKLMKQKKVAYYDRGARIGQLEKSYSFEKTINILKKTFGKLNPSYAEWIDVYTKNRQIDVFPRIGKTGGAYCSGSYRLPTFILLNHVNDIRSFTTSAHELGHAFHAELSRSQRRLYFQHSTSLAETASTLFEAIALETVSKEFSAKEKIYLLHNKISDDISTIFRQIACFNFEHDIHKEIKSKGFLSKEELADLHNKNMQAYLGPLFKLERDDGFFFVQWSHIRRFFYVYTYAYGSLVSKALLRRYRQDPAFWKNIEKLLSAGGSASPEDILKSIGINVSKPEFWRESLKEIENDINELERLIKY